jgi:hypothetical protein
MHGEGDGLLHCLQSCHGFPFCQGLSQSCHAWHLVSCWVQRRLSLMSGRSIVKMADSLGHIKNADCNWVVERPWADQTSVLLCQLISLSSPLVQTHMFREATRGLVKVPRLYQSPPSAEQSITSCAQYEQILLQCVRQLTCTPDGSH